MSTAQSWVWTGGRVLPADTPLWLGLDRGALYGDGLFETLRVINRRATDLAAHLRRIHNSATALAYPDPDTLVMISRQAVEEMLSHVPRSDGLLRITWTRGVGERGFAPTGGETPTVTVHHHPLPVNLARRRRGVRAVVVTGLYPGSLAGHKSTSSLVYVEAARRAHVSSADEALLEDGAGGLSEATSANLFAVIDEVLVTPPLSLPVLPGITRSWVLEHVTSVIEERPITAQELHRASEAFLTNSVAGVFPLLEVDGEPIGDGTPGPRTLALQTTLDEHWIAAANA